MLMSFFLLRNRIRVRSPLAILSLLLILSLNASGQSIQDWVGTNCEQCTALMAEKTGAYILERGEQALMGRAWLTQHATQSIEYSVLHLEYRQYRDTRRRNAVGCG